VRHFRSARDTALSLRCPNNKEDQEPSSTGLLILINHLIESRTPVIFPNRDTD